MGKQVSRWSIAEFTERGRVIFYRGRLCQPHASGHIESGIVCEPVSVVAMGSRLTARLEKAIVMTP